MDSDFPLRSFREGYRLEEFESRHILMKVECGGSLILEVYCRLESEKTQIKRDDEHFLLCFRAIDLLRGFQS